MNPVTRMTLAATLALATIGISAPHWPVQAVESISTATQQRELPQSQTDILLAQFGDFDFDDYDGSDRNDDDRNDRNNNRNDRNNGDRWNNSDRQGNSDRWRNNDRRDNGANRNDDDWNDADRWDRGDSWDNDDDRWNDNDDNDRWDNDDDDYRGSRNGCYGLYANRDGAPGRGDAEVIAREFLGCQLGIDPYSNDVEIVGVGSDRRNWVVRGKVDGEFFRIDIDSDDAEVVNFDPPNGRNNNDDDNDRDVIFF